MVWPLRRLHIANFAGRLTREADDHFTPLASEVVEGETHALDQRIAMVLVSVLRGAELGSSLKSRFARPWPELIPRDVAFYTASFTHQSVI
jgi:hypothetical protein